MPAAQILRQIKFGLIQIAKNDTLWPFEITKLWFHVLSGGEMIKFQQNQTLTSHFESFWSIVSQYLGSVIISWQNVPNFRSLSCEEVLPWNGGTTLLNYISSAKFFGLTGPVSFAESKRTNFKLDLLKLKDHKMSKVGEWNALTGLNITDKYAFLQGKKYI